MSRGLTMCRVAWRVQLRGATGTLLHESQYAEKQSDAECQFARLRRGLREGERLHLQKREPRAARYATIETVSGPSLVRS